VCRCNDDTCMCIRKIRDYHPSQDFIIPVTTIFPWIEACSIECVIIRSSASGLAYSSLVLFLGRVNDSDTQPRKSTQRVTFSTRHSMCHAGNKLQGYSDAWTLWNRTIFFYFINFLVLEHPIQGLVSLVFWLNVFACMSTNMLILCYLESVRMPI